MTCGEAINARLADINMTKVKLASTLTTTKQNLANKFARDNFSADELVDICAALDLQLAFLDKKGKVKYIISDKAH